ncbi:sensor histidine kinase [Pseudoalteromonas phenolica]|uniref:Histidine kinase internal region n=1 Tax=Pseudoalteromonas phenolica TaxID=161398 RepID=A0A0S2K0X0_9GAMM|nr:histidine kinase [Pseudoalteromonas phenolica]ALO41634.1 histidine kinase internal region [Pseudoalteromonas phenolica]MBE0353816.1 two-component system, LytT family, sensor kinase [Pseudoalteromonas phenolica O-BC30]
MKNIRLQRNEQIVALAAIALISLTISITDWLQRGMLPSFNILLSAVSAVLFMYWLPMIISYLLVIKFKINRWLLQWISLFLSISLGAFFWGEIRALFIPLQGIGFLQALLISLPWSTMIFVAVKFYLTQKHLKLEEQLRKQAEINLLHSQLNPHFLFNSLNTIASFARTQPTRCEDLVHDLAAVLRYSLSQSGLNQPKKSAPKEVWVKLSDELVILNKWCDIERSRFGDNLRINFDIDDDLLDKVVPAMLLQPLIENAIKHGKSTPLHIWITVRHDAQHMLFNVRDNGVGFDESYLINANNKHTSKEHRKLEQDKGAHFGLEITQARLELEAGARLEFSNTPEGGANVEFKLQLGS